MYTNISFYSCSKRNVVFHININLIGENFCVPKNGIHIIRIRTARFFRKCIYTRVKRMVNITCPKSYIMACVGYIIKINAACYIIYPRKIFESIFFFIICCLIFILLTHNKFIPAVRCPCIGK